MTNKNEKILKIEERLAQLENQKKKLIQKQKADERKARTKRLIERGAILESLIDGAAELTNEQITSILNKTVGSSYGVKIVSETKSQDGVVSAPLAEASQEETE